MKKRYHFGRKLQSRAEKNCDDKVVFVKYFRDFKAFSGIMHTMSNIIFQVMSYMDGDFNIIHGNEKYRLAKSPLLESHGVPVTEKQAHNTENLGSGKYHNSPRIQRAGLVASRSSLPSFFPFPASRLVV